MELRLRDWGGRRVGGWGLRVVGGRIDSESCFDVQRSRSMTRILTAVTDIDSLLSP